MQRQWISNTLEGSQGQLKDSIARDRYDLVLTNDPAEIAALEKACLATCFTAGKQ